MTYRSFNTETWRDPWFESLSFEARYLFIYLWTNEDCSMAGIYRTSIRRIAFETKLPEAKIPDLLDEISKAVTFFPEDQIIIIHHFIRYQCASKSKFLVGAIAFINKYFPKYLTQIAVYNYKQFNELNPVLYNTDTLSIPYPKPTDTLSIPVDTLAISATATATATATAEKKEGEESPAPPSCSDLAKTQDAEPPQPPKKSRKTKIIQDESPIVFSFPVIHPNGDPETWPLHQSLFDKFQDTYKGLDVMQEVKKARLWIDANNRKTYNGMAKFLTGWMDRAQNQLRGSPQPRQTTYKQRFAEVESTKTLG